MGYVDKDKYVVTEQELQGNDANIDDKFYIGENGKLTNAKGDELDLNEWLKLEDEKAEERDAKNEQDATDYANGLYGTKESISKTAYPTPPKKSDYIWNREMTDKYFPTIDKQEEESREKQARTNEWITRLGQAAAALGNAFSVAGGAVSQDIAEVKAPDVHTWKEALAQKRLAKAQMEQGQQQAYEKAVGNWVSQVNKQGQIVNKRLEDWEKARRDFIADRNKSYQNYVKNTLDAYKIKQSAEESEKNRKSRERSASIKAANSSNGSKEGKYEFNGTKYPNKDMFAVAVHEAVSDWNSKHPDNKINETYPNGSAKDATTLAADYNNKVKA